MSDSWDLFMDALVQESGALSAMNAAALELTGALVARDPEAIAQAERALDASRQLYSKAAGVRRSMQVRGFGAATLRQVCAHAPRHLAATFNARLSELVTLSISLGITIANNKSLILAGMERLLQVTTALQRASNEEPGTYRRRGFVPPPSNSVLVSSRA